MSWAIISDQKYYLINSTQNPSTAWNYLIDPVGIKHSKTSTLSTNILLCFWSQVLSCFDGANTLVYGLTIDNTLHREKKGAMCVSILFIHSSHTYTHIENSDWSMQHATSQYLTFPNHQRLHLHSQGSLHLSQAWGRCLPRLHTDNLECLFHFVAIWALILPETQISVVFY